MTEILKQTDGIINFDILINRKNINDIVEVQEITLDKEAL